MCASLYKRPKSKFWWIKFRDPISGKVKQESTRFVIGRGDDLRRARELEAERSLAETRTRTLARGTRFEEWVAGWIELHYRNPHTLARIQATWRSLRAYFAEKEIAAPEQLRREHCLGYLEWRQKLGHANSKRARVLKRNTVILELKFLSKLMQEAVNRGYVQYNVATHLGLARERPKEKAEMTDDHVALIRAAIARRVAQAKTEPEKINADFLRVSFEIALHQGCRLNETYLNLREQVNLEHGELTLHAKGDQIYVAQLNPHLVPFLRALIEEGRTWSYQRPRMPSLVWFDFFDRLRKKHPSLRNVSFHSTRVRVVSRLERAGAPEAAVKKVVNHASTTVHRVYRRVTKDELNPFWSALAPATPPTPADTSAPAPAGSGGKGRKNPKP